MNIWDIIIVLLITASVLLAVRTLHRSRKTGCACGCAGCPFQDCKVKKARG